MNGVRVRAMSFRCPLRGLPRWREARARVEHGHLLVRFLLRGVPTGEVYVPLRALSDMSNFSFLPSGVTALRFSFVSGEHIIVLGIGDNPLVYSVEDYEYLIYSIFSTALNGAPIGISGGGEVYHRAFIKLFPGELILMAGEPIHVERIDGAKVTADDGRTFFLNAPERMLRLMKHYLERYKPKIGK